MVKPMNKLVRDRIPEIIRARGAQPAVRVLDDAEYKKCLADKLREEALEFCQSGEVEELCDLLEVIDAILRVQGVTAEQAARMRMEKAIQNGVFERRLYLESVSE